METLAWNGIPISASFPLNSGIIVEDEVEDCKRQREWLFVEKQYFQDTTVQLLMTFPNSYIFKTVQDQISEIVACIEGKLKMPTFV